MVPTVRRSTYCWPSENMAHIASVDGLVLCADGLVHGDHACNSRVRTDYADGFVGRAARKIWACTNAV